MKRTSLRFSAGNGMKPSYPASICLEKHVGNAWVPGLQQFAGLMARQTMLRPVSIAGVVSWRRYACRLSGTGKPGLCCEVRPLWLSAGRGAGGGAWGGPPHPGGWAGGAAAGAAQPRPAAVRRAGPQRRALMRSDCTCKGASCTPVQNCMLFVDCWVLQKMEEPQHVQCRLPCMWVHG